MQSWVPCLFFSGGVTVGVVGRALATVSETLSIHYFSCEKNYDRLLRDLK